MSVVDSAGKYLEVDKRYVALRNSRIRDGNKRLVLAYKRQIESRRKMRAHIKALLAPLVRLFR